MKMTCHAGLNASVGKASVRWAVLALLCWLPALAQPAMAEGVLAVGITKDVAKDGFVIGYSINKYSRWPKSGRAEAWNF